MFFTAAQQHLVSPMYTRLTGQRFPRIYKQRTHRRPHSRSDNKNVIKYSITTFIQETYKPTNHWHSTCRPYYRYTGHLSHEQPTSHTCPDQMRGYRDVVAAVERGDTCDGVDNRRETIAFSMACASICGDDGERGKMVLKDLGQLCRFVGGTR